MCGVSIALERESLEKTTVSETTCRSLQKIKWLRESKFGYCTWKEQQYSIAAIFEFTTLSNKISLKYKAEDDAKGLSRIPKLAAKVPQKQ